MQVADYILDFLASRGVKKVFLITGGAIAFVVDAFSRRDDISYVCCAHEQGAAIMADAYSRLGPGQAATMVTSGPGATNLITGICCSHFDSIPVIHISGQVNMHEMRGAHPGTDDVRQVGFQETQIVEIVSSITKWAVQLRSEKDVRYVFEKADYISKTGRPGPVLIDIPMNLQRMEINPKKLRAFNPPKKSVQKDTGTVLQKKVNRVIKLMQKAERPVLLSGGGVRLADAVEEMQMLVSKTKFPVATSWSGYDSIPFKNPYYVGSHGVYGFRSANFAVQNSDLLITIGSRLDTRQTGGRPETFARESKLVMVDVDKAELNKRRGLTPHISIEADAKEFLTLMLQSLPSDFSTDISEWRKICRNWMKKYPMVAPEYYDQKGSVNAYVFGKALSDLLDKNAVIIPDDGGHLTWAMQSIEIKNGQRMFSAFGNSPMGYAFPAAIGASVALGKKQVICIDGDGSFLMNMQELQTLAYENLPVKVFVYNNSGYGIIRQFQELYCGARFEATAESTGVTVPDFVKVGKAFNIKTERIRNHSELGPKLKGVLDYEGPVICEVMLDPGQKIIPKLMFGNPIEDLSPELPRDEFHNNMLVKPIGADRKVQEAN